jgi:mevalonate kinase
MTQYTSAPAKIILLGEHAVVYGIPAIAIPVSSLRTTATIELWDKPFTVITEDLKKDGIALSVNFNTVDSPLSKMGMLIFNHFNQLVKPNVKITLKSDIPIASGLGSGAAISTALGRAITIALRKNISDDVLNTLVHEVEKIHHGTPSGIDNTVIVYEMPIYFIKDKGIRHLDVLLPFHIVIADTGQTALTHESVGDVRKLHNSNPTEMQIIFDKINTIVGQALTCIATGDIPQLGQLMTENHHQLQQLTVSSPKLDELVSTALDAGALGAKLSGGGRGGNMIALVEENNIQSVKHALQQAGAVRVFDSIVK